MNRFMLVFALLTTTSAFAETTPASDHGKASCKQGNNTRRVEVGVGDADTKQSCNVRYFKDQEAPGEGKVLWSANNLEGFCIEKAKGFVAKLVGMGWNCEGDLVATK